MIKISNGKNVKNESGSQENFKAKVEHDQMLERTEGKTNECEQYVIIAKMFHRPCSPWYMPMGTKALSNGMSDAVRCSLSSSSHLTARLRLPT